MKERGHVVVALHVDRVGVGQDAPRVNGVFLQGMAVLKKYP